MPWAWAVIEDHASDTGHLRGGPGRGGKSSRFGRDKALYHHEGKPLMEHVTGVLSEIFSEIAIIADEVERYSRFGYPVRPDLVPDFGPLGGIFTALTLSQTDMTFVVAADMPFLNAPLIEYMISLASGSDIVAPCLGGFYETLHTIYSKRCLVPIRRFIDNSDRRVFAFYEGMKMRVLEENELRRFGDPDTMFKNVNVPGDL